MVSKDEKVVDWTNLPRYDTNIIIESKSYNPSIKPKPKPTPKNNNNSNNSKDEVNLPLVIGVSVGGFVLLAVIVYYFMGKGRRSRRSKKVSNNKMNANRGGAKKAGRGRSK
tara:strand:- start:1886 stop:2218 length:333 start_codon:yes stop_codon:yes gene_type:complete